MLDLVILGLVQGLTEFLPVSSSAHLLFAEHYLGIARPGLVIEGVLHLGTVAAVVWLFWADIVRLLRAAPALVRPPAPGDPRDGDRRMLLAILAATAVTGALGLAFAGPLQRTFESVHGAAYQLMATGVILALMRERGTRAARQASVADGAAMGLAQAVAILPGISRSGITIAAGLFRGLGRAEAARLSFLMAIPAIVGAGLFSLKDATEAASLGYGPVELVVGAVVAAGSGALAIVWLLDILRRGRLVWFAVYCWAAAVAVLATTR
ncbi:MAG: undecaprenyl-diphosphate phosphatase [Armatimonadota bacterium]|nr:undecaprenyl-diphosphate phosphatase [Armatimonadota bacterium]MDR7456416.1 undecaprenyl-diphosphate phosphatase [Armatimonadota bacterium]MDR7513037.1 undecaprenyl-diphosphate phosphatase [Armatimonadota bacterium]